MKQYEASVMIDNELKKVEFETDGNQVEYLWQLYGMSTYIEYINEIEISSEIEIKLED